MVSKAYLKWDCSKKTSKLWLWINEIGWLNFDKQCSDPWFFAFLILLPLYQTFMLLNYIKIEEILWKNASEIKIAQNATSELISSHCD